MYSKIKKSVFGAVLGGVILVAAGTASAGAPEPGANFDCQKLLGAFLDACNVNNDLADGIGGAYTGSCKDGGRCDDSVYNKLLSASSKVEAGKVYPDACNNLASIQFDLMTWAGADKPKIDGAGYYNLSAEITKLQTAYGCK